MPPTMTASAAVKRPRRAALEAHVSTLMLPTLGQIRGIQADVDGTLFLATSSALYTYSCTGRLALFAGSPSETGYFDGDCCEARFNHPTGLAVTPDGSLLVADSFNNCVRCVSPHGHVFTVAGSASGQAGLVDGMGETAHFNCPWAIALDPRSGILYVSDVANHCIRKVVPGEWAVSTLCGGSSDTDTEGGYLDGLGAQARFSGPRGLALDLEGNLIVADSGNHCIWKVDLPTGARVSTVAGSQAGGEEGAGFADGQGSSARFDRPLAVAVDGTRAIPALEACPEKGLDTSSGGKPEATKDPRVTTGCPLVSAEVHYLRTTGEE